MYHIEFYKRILGENKFTSPSFLSGIIGDAWAEAGKFKQVNSVDDITALGYSHGMSLAEKHSQIKLTTEDKVNFYNYVKNYIKSDRVKAVMAMRLKLQLISYLTQIPEYFGLPVWTPFLNFNIVKNILNLPDDRRINRAWQVDLFQRTGLNLEEMGLRSSRTNKLNYIIGKKTDFEPLDTNLLSSYAKIDRIQEINETLNRETGLQQLINELLYVPKISGVLRRLGFKNKFLIALNEYYVLKALEKGLKYER